MKYILTVDPLDYERIAAAIPNSITGTHTGRTELIVSLPPAIQSVSKYRVPVRTGTSTLSALVLATGTTGQPLSASGASALRMYLQ